MKLYKCLMLDDSMEDDEPCIIAALETLEERDYYFNDSIDNKGIRRNTLLASSGYTDYEEDQIEFWFCHPKYAKEIADDIGQYAGDTDYYCFEYIEPTKKV